jgi:hypothetical protein
VSGDQSWIGWVLFRLVPLPIWLLWALIKRDWKAEDEKKKREQSGSPDSDPR